MCGGDRAPSGPLFAAFEADARPNGQHAACTMRNATLGARGAFAFPRVRSRMLSGGGACIAGARPPPPARQALLLGRKARILRLVRGRLAANYGPQQRHVQPQHLHSQQQTLSTASQVEQA